MKNSKYLFIFLLSYAPALGSTLFPAGADTKETICDGRIPRYSPKVTVKFKYPDTKGMPIDEAAKKKSERLETVRVLLKRGYFSQYFFDARSEWVDGYWESIGKEAMDPTLAKLRDTYTMRIPIPTLKSTFKMDSEMQWKNMGFDYYTKTWKASKAIEDADWIWQNYLYRMTTVTETAKESGETVFEVQLDLSLFCQSAVYMKSMVSTD